MDWRHSLRKCSSAAACVSLQYLGSTNHRRGAWLCVWSDSFGASAHGVIWFAEHKAGSKKEHFIDNRSAVFQDGLL